MKYIVRAEYVFEIEAENEKEALIIADHAIKYYIINPQTDEPVSPNWDIEEKT